MTPLPLSTPEDSESPPPSQGGDRPERSRNAKAQARHRAKRKAYIEQLEQTVTKLQYALSLSPDQVAVLPPPIVRIRELEEQNKELLRQIDDMQAQLADRQRGGGGGGGGSGHGHSLRPAAHPHRSSSGPVLPSFDDRGDHDTAKRRRTVEGPGDLSLMARPSQSPLQVAIPREYLPYPPHHSPATPMLPAPYTLQYQFPEPHQQQQQQQHQQHQHASATSSPSAASFSSDGAYSPQMHAPHEHAPHAYAHEQHARAQQHPASPSYPAVLHPYARAAPPTQSQCQSQNQPHQYEQPVKIEEDAYPVAAQNMGYGSALAAYGGNSALGNWHGYGDGA